MPRNETDTHHSICRIENRRAYLKCDQSSEWFTFVILADPQFGLYERYVEKRSEPYGWLREQELLHRAIAVINKLLPVPLFVLICGDIVDAPPGSDYNAKQTSDILSTLSKLNSNINILTLPGNHDVGDHPTESDISSYCQTWGQDYYSFETEYARFIVLNSQFMWSDKFCIQKSYQFDIWLKEQLEYAKKDTNRTTITFQHIPFFVESDHEPDDYFNVPREKRATMLPLLHSSGVRYSFTGHLHRNSTQTWLPSKISSSGSQVPLHLVTTSSVCVPLSKDPPGLRLVRIASDETVRHKYWSIEALEALLANGGQPDFDYSVPGMLS